MAGTNFVTNIVIGGKISPTLQRAFSIAGRYAQKTSNIISRANTKMAAGLSTINDKIGNTVKNAGLAIGAGVAFASYKSIQLASDLREAQNVVDVTFGKNAKAIDAWAKQAKKSFGLSTLEAKNFAGTMGSMLKASGFVDNNLAKMSTNLAGLAGDIASFRNMTKDEAFTILMSGMAGETEPLRRLGINMTVANLEAYALSKGIKVSYEEMNQAAQTALRYSYIMSHTKDIQGDFARTQGSFANQSRLAITNLSEIGAKLADKLIPYLEKGLQAANNFMDGLLSDPARIDKMAQKISSFADATIKFGKFVVEHGPEIISTAKLIGKALLAWATISAVNKTYTTASGIVGFFKKAIPIVKDFIQYQVYLRGLYAKDAIVMAARTVATWAMVAAQGALNVAMTIGSTVASAFGAVMAFLTSPIGLVILAVTALIGIIYLLYKNWDTISKALVSVWQTYVVPAFQSIAAWFGNLFAGISAIFKSVINFIIGGINNLISRLNSIKINVPDWVPGVGGKQFGINIPTIPTFAQGGFAKRPSIFGEAGLEAAIPIRPKSPRSISLLNQTAKMLGVDSVGGSPITVIYSPNIHGGNVAEIKPILDVDFERFKAWAEQFFHDQRRESFA